MKILFIAPSAYLLGGVQDWLFLLVCGLRREGHEVIVGVPDNAHHRVDRFNEHFCGIDAKSFTNKTGTQEGRIIALTEFLINNPTDLIVGVNIGDIYKAFCRAKHRLVRSRLVITVHAIEQNYFDDLREYACLVDGVITTNQLTQLLINNMGLLQSGRVFYAPYGIALRHRNSPIIKRDFLSFAWVGRIEIEQKRVSDVSRILKELDEYGLNYTLSIAGDGPYREQLEKDLGYWTQRGMVKFYGFLSKGDMADFYYDHDILLITSKWETGPIVAWEAMASGLAIVTSEYIGSKSEKALIDNVTALMFPVGDSRKAADQIMRLKDRDVRERISVAGKEMVVKRYSEAESLNAWTNAFTNVLELDAMPESSDTDLGVTRPSGRIERLFGVAFSEKLRLLSPFKNIASGPGNEWPHSLQGKTDQRSLLEYAEQIEALS